jgi:drug/metabolite transporter (DMT)-like permease
MKLSQSAKADLALVLITIIWGASFTVVKRALAQVSPVLFLSLRFWIAAIVSTAFLGGALRKGVSLETLRRSALLALFMAGGFVFQTIGLRGTTPSKSAFLTSLCVLLVPLLGYAIFRRRPAVRTLLGVVLATIGLGLLTLTSWDFGFRYGETLTLICAIVFALHILFLGRYAPQCDIRQLFLLQLAMSAVFCTLLIPTLETTFLVWDLTFLFYLLFASLLATALAFYLQNRAQQLTTSNRAALIFSLEPFFAAIFSYLLSGNSLTGKEWIGGVLVIAGVLVSEFRRK